MKFSRKWIRKTRRESLLIEILIAISLVALCALPLVNSLTSTYIKTGDFFMEVLKEAEVENTFREIQWELFLSKRGAPEAEALTRDNVFGSLSPEGVRALGEGQLPSHIIYLGASSKTFKLVLKRAFKIEVVHQDLPPYILTKDPIKKDPFDEKSGDVGSRLLKITVFIKKEGEKQKPLKTAEEEKGDPYYYFLKVEQKGSSQVPPEKKTEPAGE